MALTNPRWRDHVKRYVNVITHTVGKHRKAQVVEFQCEALYKKGKCHIILNAHYPDRMPTVLFDPSPLVLHKAINSMSFDPEEMPEKEKIVTENLLTGTRIIQEKAVKHKKKEGKSKEEVEEIK